MRVVEIVEVYVQERELPRLARDLVGLGRVKLPPDFLILVEDELRLQPAEDLADVLLQAQRDGEVHVVVPRDQAVVAPGPDECARVHEEGNAGPGQGVGERVDGGQHHVLLASYQLHLEASGRQSGWNNVVAQALVT